jgi:hypothetical protein
MLLLAAAAAIAVSAQPPRGPVAPRVQAHVTIRILSGATVRFGAAREGAGGTERTVTIRAEGVEQPAKLIEFQ